MTETAMRARPRIRLRRWQAVALVAIIPMGGVAAYAGTNVWTSLAQRSLRAGWEQAMSAAPISPAELATRTFAANEPVARMAIPAIGLDVIVVEGGNGRRGPAHVASSVIPGLPGLSTIKGGRFGFGNHFLNLSQLAPGDLIGVQTRAGQTSFVIRSVEILPASRIDPAADAARPALLLIAPARTFGTNRVVLRAETTA